jgi:hypothetical protein
MQEVGIRTKYADPSVKLDIGRHVMIGSSPPDFATKADFPLKETLAELGRRLTAGSLGEASVGHAAARRMPTSADLRQHAQRM